MTGAEQALLEAYRRHAADLKALLAQVMPLVRREAEREARGIRPRSVHWRELLMCAEELLELIEEDGTSDDNNRRL